MHAKRKTFVLWDLGHRARVEEAPHVNHQQAGYDRGRQKEKGLPASSPALGREARELRSGEHSIRQANNLAVQHLIKSQMLQSFSFIPNNIANYFYQPIFIFTNQFLPTFDFSVLNNTFFTTAIYNLQISAYRLSYRYRAPIPDLDTTMHIFCPGLG